jgi:ferritin
MGLYAAVALYVSMAHYFETTGLKAVCRALVEETKAKLRARKAVEYLIPVSSRIIATVLVVVFAGRVVKEG